MTELSEYLLKPETSNFTNRKFIVPRYGEEHPITLRVISATDYQNALTGSIKWGKNHTNEGRDGHLFMVNVCLAGLVDPNPNDTNDIKAADEIITKRIGESQKEVEDAYKKAMAAWEKNGKEGPEPVKEKPYSHSRIIAPKDLVEFYLLPGEITQVAEKILELSGFGIDLKEATNKAKN